MKSCENAIGRRNTATSFVSRVVTSSPALEASPPGNTFSRRQLLTRLTCFSAALAAAPAVAANPPLPRRQHCGEQLLALAECQKALDALPSEADCPTLKDLHERYCNRPIHKKIVPTTRSGRTVDVAVFQTGKIGADRVAVLIHGV